MKGNKRGLEKDEKCEYEYDVVILWVRRLKRRELTGRLPRAWSEVEIS